MAVEKSKVITRLKALFPKANLSQQRLDAIADKLAKKPADDADDSAIDAVINDFNEILSFEEIAKDDDRTRTLEKKAKDAENKDDKSDKKDSDKDEVKVDANTPEWAKALIESNKSLKADLESIKSGKVIEGKKQTAAQLFDKSEVLKGLKPELKERWLNRIDVNSETSFEDQISSLESEYTELVQANADNGNYSSNPPANGGKDSKFSAEQADEIVADMKI